VSACLAVFFGIALVGLLIYEEKTEQKQLIIYAAVIFVPAHFFPILFWIGLYFYYGALVNSSYGDIAMYLNDVGNIIDSV